MSGDSCNLQTSPGDWQKREPEDNGPSGNAHRQFTGKAPGFLHRTVSAESNALAGSWLAYRRLLWVSPSGSAPGAFPDSAP
jgi:hypothetical protein